MRSRERLIEVLKTVNRDLYPEFGQLIDAVVYCLTNECECVLCWDNMSRTYFMHCSPHIRELAAEAQHYLGEGKP